MNSEVKMWIFGFFFIIYWVIGCSADSSPVAEMKCCSQATGSCRNVCTQISLVTLGAEAAARDNASRILSEFCSNGMTEFWSCVNTTLSNATKNEDWVGRGCCHLAQHINCRSTCALAGSKSHLRGFCRLSDEPEFYACLERREESEHCCNNVANMTCRSVCRDLFDEPGKQSSLKLYSSMGCFHQIPKCLKKVAESSTADNQKQYLSCCEKAMNLSCLDACRKTLYTATSVNAILDTLVEKCGTVRPQIPLWSCFLQSGSTKPPRLPLDIGKLSCCSRGTSSKCQDLCWRAFQADWEVAWNQLESDCLSSPMEGELRRCLEDADDPCEMGCSGLSYCARFNDKSDFLFRDCSSTADDAAKWEADHWSRGGIIRGLGVSVRADPSCPAETLRAAACLLKVRPCESRTHESRLCRNDCLELMSNCVDWSAMAGSSHTAATLCSKLSPPRADMPCVSLKPFMETPEIETNFLPEEDISTPCKNSPCSENEICVVDPNLQGKLYTCLPSCSLGEMSKLSVPVNTWVQIPRVDQLGCLRICQCTLKGLEKCRSLNCFNINSCWVQDRFIGHRGNFYLDCNSCQCFEGEITCSRRMCGSPKLSDLPCACPAHYVPVCGRLGVTFASACLAKCAGLLLPNDFEFGSCSSKDPCKPNPCKIREKCLRKRRVCLSPIHKPCEQYECVAENCESKDIQSGPVCDKNNQEHPSICALIKSGVDLAYRGPCLKDCSLRGPVCGINGEVYSSECAAWAEKTVVDYDGPCVAVGLIGDEIKERCGEVVKCPKLKIPNCIGVTPPGACCPVCGGAARIFYSRKQLDRINYMMNDESDKEAVVLETMLTALGRQLQVAQCSLRGSVTPEGDIFIISQPTSKNPSTIQQRACLSEIEKLVTRITERSPKVAAEVPLGSLTRAEIAHGDISAAILSKSTILVFLLPLLAIGSCCIFFFLTVCAD